MSLVVKRLTALTLLLISGAASVSAQEPLHVRIDQAIAAATPDYAAKSAALSSDAEFLRRVTLDLTGTIPTAEEARRFLNDVSPEKRQAAVERLLASPEFAAHMADVFDVFLMERRLDFHQLASPFKEYLRASFSANKKWDQLVHEILSTDGDDPAIRPAVRFYLDRENQPHLLTRDISRLFLGKNLECAQRHDHPLIQDYFQADYYGLYAFLNRTVLFNDPVKKITILGEKADGDVTFVSVFDPEKKVKSSGPHMPLLPKIEEPSFEKGQEYLVAPADNVRPQPRHSRRALLAPKLTDPGNVAFRRNIANRLWAQMLGRGLIHPLDGDHEANPPSHPELLTLLADDLAAHQFDMRYFLKELTLSRTYQLSSQLPTGGIEDPARFAAASLKPLSPEVLAWSLMQATGQVEAIRKSQGAAATDESVRKALAVNLAPFIQTFGNGIGAPQTFFVRSDQALFLANGAPLRLWFSRQAGSLIDRLAGLETPDAVADELYLSILTRLPDDEERQEVREHLAAVPPAERLAALQELSWALVASTEFRFNH